MWTLEGNNVPWQNYPCIEVVKLKQISTKLSKVSAWQSIAILESLLKSVVHERIPTKSFAKTD